MPDSLDPIDCSVPGFPVLHYLPVCSNSCPLSQWCHPTISSSVVPFFSCPILSQHQGLFQWVSSSHRWPKYWSVSFRISPSNGYSGLISFRTDWFDLHVVKGLLLSFMALVLGNLGPAFGWVSKVQALRQCSLSGTDRYRVGIYMTWEFVNPRNDTLKRQIFH